jgi:DNA-binding transcriptional LysR family regulator
MPRESFHDLLAFLAVARERSFSRREDLAEPYLANEQLIRVLEEWSPPWPGYHLYYPSRRQSSPALSLLVDALRHRS